MPTKLRKRRRRRAIREDGSEEGGPGPNLLRRGRFAALAEDDTESVDNHQPDRCAEEVTQEAGCQGIPARRRRSLWILWQEAEADERVTRCAPTQIEPDRHDERLARVRQADTHGSEWAPDVREVRAVIQVFSAVGREGGSCGS